MLLIKSKPIRAVIRWQVYVTAAMTLLAGSFWGIHAGFSALLGGLVSMASGGVFALLAHTERAGSTAGALRTALRAEAAKITVVVLLLWLVLTTYKEVVALAFLGAFFVTILIFSAAIAVRDE